MKTTDKKALSGDFMGRAARIMRGWDLWYGSATPFPEMDKEELLCVVYYLINEFVATDDEKLTQEQDNDDD